VTSSPLGVAVALDAVVVRAGAVAPIALLGAFSALLARLLALVAARLEVRLAALLALLSQLARKTHST